MADSNEPEFLLPKPETKLFREVEPRATTKPNNMNYVRHRQIECTLSDIQSINQ
jgi:hypothetical protein